MVPPPGVQQLSEQSPHFSLSCENFENLFCEYFFKFPKTLFYICCCLSTSRSSSSNSRSTTSTYTICIFNVLFLGQKYALNDWWLFLPVGPLWRSSAQMCLREHLMGRLMEPPLCSRPECSNVQLDPLYQFAYSTDQLFYSFPCKAVHVEFLSASTTL